MNLIERYPSAELIDSVKADSTYRVIFDQMTMAKVMTKVPSEMFTIVRKPETGKFYQAISTDDTQWLLELNSRPGMDSIYLKGGMIGLYESEDGKRLGAVSPVMNEKGEAVGVLQVEETFDSFFAKAKDQIYRNIAITLIFIFIIGVLMFFSVKSILKQQEKLQLQKQELEQFRQELLANISHDLRTPLSGIHGYLETMIMKKDSLDEQTRQEYLQSSLQSTAKLKYLVDELFELSRLESKERKLEVESFCVRELAYDVINNFKLVAQEKGIEIRVDSEETMPRVHADLALIDRTIQNLLSNAVKYCKTGDSITLSIKRKGEKIWVSVSDTGAGIAEADIPHLFERFYKGKTAQQGTGLGLAIVKSILDLHHSEYFVNSKEGEGTTFRFSLNI
jgi:signal transduction histidine kinase